jgi:DNA segregation ATPase FtsK/SpoIIIE-like protein
MNAAHPPPNLAELRRQLEEILAIVSGDAHTYLGSGAQLTSANRALSEPHKTYRTALTLTIQSDELFDKALAVITEFGQTSPAILQMWLGIDYRRAVEVLKQFESQGLISSKGRVRHKAYDLRRSRDLEHPSVSPEALARLSP